MLCGSVALISRLSRVSSCFKTASFPIIRPAGRQKTRHNSIAIPYARGARHHRSGESHRQQTGRPKEGAYQQGLTPKRRPASEHPDDNGDCIRNAQGHAIPMVAAIHDNRHPGPWQEFMLHTEPMVIHTRTVHCSITAEARAEFRSIVLRLSKVDSVSYMYFRKGTTIIPFLSAC